MDTLGTWGAQGAQQAHAEADMRRAWLATELI